MRKLKLKYALLFCPFFALANDTTLLTNSISIHSKILIESNALNLDFANHMLFGGYINDNIKEDWFEILQNNNSIFSEFSNGITFKKSYPKSSFFVSLEDRNFIRTNFSDSLFRLIFLGNYNFQDQELTFKNTFIGFDRFQQLKIGFSRNFNIKQKAFALQTALSYLNGNQHFSFYSPNASFYTAPNGTYNDLQYTFTAFATDTSSFNLLENNGNGLAWDFAFSHQAGNKKYTIYVKDLGFILWKENNLSFSTDTSFTFQGITINDITEFNDSILQNEQDKFVEDILLENNNKHAKSYLPAHVGIQIEADNQGHFFSKYIAGIDLRWQPFADDKLLSPAKITQGIIQSGYNPYFYVQPIAITKIGEFYPQIGIGGYAQKASIGLGSKFGKRFPLNININHLESVFQGKMSQNLHVFSQFTINF